MSTVVTNSRHGDTTKYQFIHYPGQLVPLQKLLKSVFRPSNRKRIVTNSSVTLFTHALLPRLINTKLLRTDRVPHRLTRLDPARYDLRFCLSHSRRNIRYRIGTRCNSTVIPLLPSNPAIRTESRHSVPLSQNIVKHSFSTRRLTVSMIHRFFAVPSRHGHITTTARRAIGKFQASTTQGATGRFISSTTAVSHSSAARVIHLFSRKLPTLGRMKRIFAAPTFSQLVTPGPPDIGIKLSVGNGLIRVSPLTSRMPPSRINTLLSSCHQHRQFRRLGSNALIGLDNTGLDALSQLTDSLSLDRRRLGSKLVRLPNNQTFLLSNRLPSSNSSMIGSTSFARCVSSLGVVSPGSCRIPSDLGRVLHPCRIRNFR